MHDLRNGDARESCVEFCEGLVQNFHTEHSKVGSEPESLSKLRIHNGKQGKHIPGHHNFQSGKSELTHPHPQDLLDKGAGTGIKHGSKEVVDFGETIGFHVDKESNTRFPTTRGTIHYDSKGIAHIVPARPYPKEVT